tara:strand:+ start:7421 stop:9061 length:1641 start_codon:yes stop_codon:yes gene_type:complete
MASEANRKQIEEMREKRLQNKKQGGTELSLGEVASQAVGNLPKSALKYAEDLVTPITDPVGTAKGLYSFAAGLIQLAVPGEQADEKTVKAVGDYFANRYGSLEAFKLAVAEDPVGVVGDVSTVLTGGGMLAARAPGMVGKAGAALEEAGRKIDPLAVAGNTLQAAGGVVTEGVPAAIGMTTGAGKESIQQAFNAGRVGGETDRRFVENLRGQEEPGAIVQDGIAALRRLKETKQNKFVTSKEALQLEKMPVDFDALAAKVGEFAEKFNFEGVSELSELGQNKLAKVQSLVSDWQKSPALHNAKGLDILKRRIDNEYPSGINPGDEAVVVAQARDIIKKEITDQVPEYSKVMQPYEEATRLERELQRALSLSDKASADTALRKLQSVMRNNVNANFGNRLKLVESLEEAGDYFLLPRIAGQALNSPTPRGLQAVTATGTGITGMTNPGTLAALPMFSPRVMGEVSRVAGMTRGQLDRAFDKLPKRDALSPQQQQLLDMIPDFRQLQLPLQASRLGGAIMNEDPSGQMTPEELRRLMMLRDEQRVLMQ